jgi:toluene monooxygenase system protein B
MTEPVENPVETTAGAAEPEPSLIPLNAVFANDFLEILVPVMSSNTIAELAGAVAVHVEGVRVPAQEAEKAVYHNGRRLDPALTVAAAGIAPLDHVRVDYVP